MGITLAYIVLFVTFCICLLGEWNAVLKRKKSRYLWIVFMILLGGCFMISVYADSIQIQKRSQIASQRINEAFNVDQYSVWFEQEFSEEEKRLDAYSWEEKHLNLENSENLETAANMIQNIYMSYLIKTIVVLDSDDLKIEEFRSNKGKYLGNYMDLSGECYLRTDASELFFTKKFTNLNPACKVAAFYYIYPDGEGKFIVWRPDTKWTPEELEDAEYPDGIYIGELTKNGETFDVFVRNE